MKLLIVDFLDSYSHNIPAFLRQSCPDGPHLDIDIKPYNTLDKDCIDSVAASYHGVILSAGPGTVDCAKDLGSFTPALLSYRPAIPVYGICLGFQAICRHFGGTIHRLSSPHHGLISDILTPEGVPLGRKATRYHSLEARLSESTLQELELLAIAENHDSPRERSLMEVRHRKHPFWGVQYHPESVYSHGCEVTVQPFLLAAKARCLGQKSHTNGFSHNNGIGHAKTASTVPKQVRVTWQSIPCETDLLDLLPLIRGGSTDFVLLDSSSKGQWDILAAADTSCLFRYSVREQHMSFKPVKTPIKAGKNAEAAVDCRECIQQSLCAYTAKRVIFGRSDSYMNATCVVIMISATLGSCLPCLANPEVHESIEHSLCRESSRVPFPLLTSKSSATLADAWSFLADQSTQNIFVDGPPDVPFWGGFVGYFGYELGLAELGLDAYKLNPCNLPEYGDIQLLWSTETVLYNKTTKVLYALSLKQDTTWIDATLRHAVSCQNSSPGIGLYPWIEHYKIQHPDGRAYIESIKAAQEEIKAGNSYELCLTAPSTTQEIVASSSASRSHHIDEEPASVSRFRFLRTATPAEFMSLINVGGVEMLSASPEEFLSYDAQSAIARMKPIKGTLPKKDADGNPITFQQASEFLSEPKVIAENLMIVDLVRHDLSQVSSKVTCPNLMHVEDIGPMYQLVSTVEAEVREECTAWDLIRHSLPPGSMTGAPKRRSCQILQHLEKGCRGLYSGITGYIDVRGHCRTSVNIRNTVKYPGELYWRIGAGGAITSLSSPVDEWHERQLKSTSICRCMVPAFSILETMLWNPEAGNLLYWDEHFQRLLESIQYFGFDAPDLGANDISLEESASCPSVTNSNNVSGQDVLAASHNPWQKHGLAPSTNGTSLVKMSQHGSTDQRLHSTDSATTRLSQQLYKWIVAQVCFSKQREDQLRLSLALNASGIPSLTIVRIPASKSTSRVTIHLDPLATSPTELEPFISHKTTERGHYTSARERAGVQGRDEVLMFRPDQQRLGPSQGATLNGADTDWLTEGSYTNVAFWDAGEAKWRTPGTGCLPGIMRNHLLGTGEVVVGDIQRRNLKIGTTLKLFNSVRGVFEGIIGG